MIVPDHLIEVYKRIAKDFGYINKIKNVETSEYITKLLLYLYKKADQAGGYFLKILEGTFLEIAQSKCKNAIKNIDQGKNPTYYFTLENHSYLGKQFINFQNVSHDKLNIISMAVVELILEEIIEMASNRKGELIETIPFIIKNDEELKELFSDFDYNADNNLNDNPESNINSSINSKTIYQELNILPKKSIQTLTI